MNQGPVSARHGGSVESGKPLLYAALVPSDRSTAAQIEPAGRSRSSLNPATHASKMTAATTTRSRITPNGLARLTFPPPARSPPLQSAARPRPAPRRPHPPHVPCRARGSTAAARALPWCNPPRESPRGLGCLRSGDQRPRPEIHPVNQHVIATARTSEMAGRLLLGLDPLRWRL